MKTDSNGIGFKNFRRFEDFPMLEYAAITYLVGRNNSGKSTMVKALLLVLDYLQNQLADTFSFDNQVLEDANIVTFGRAKCNLNDDKKIEFTLKLENYEIILQISGLDDRTIVKVNSLRINDEKNGYEFFINYLSQLVKVTKRARFEREYSNSLKEIETISKTIRDLKKRQGDITNKASKESLQISDLLNQLQEKRNRFFTWNQLAHNDENIEYSLEYPIKPQAIKKHISDSDDSSNSPMEVDLNIHNLVESTSNLTNLEMFTTQINTAKKQLNFAISNKIERVVFIHGGKSVLKEELISLIKQYKNIDFSEADYMQYGTTATELTIHFDEKSDENADEMRTETNELKEIISIFIYHNTNAYINIIDQRNSADSTEIEEEDLSSDIIELDNKQDELKNWIDQLVSLIDNQSFIYLGANPSKQSALFPLRDKSNSLAQAIHNFKQLGIQEGDREWRFVRYWMEEFGVGDDFDIQFYAGEAYEFHILNGNSKIHLADKGMGSLQAMLIILRIASLIRIGKKNKKKITLLVEEPELNLHPNLQSKITDFFYEVNKEFGLSFIVETHSEYIIRKSQLIGLREDYFEQNDLNINPFKIFYFHEEEGPYEMEYNSQGKFNRGFGSGFYDEASRMSMELIRQIRKNK